MAPPPTSLETSRLSSPAIALATAGRARNFSPLAFTYVRSRKRGITPQIEFSQFDPEHGRRVTPLECAVTSFASVSPLDSAVTNIGASISKQWTLSPFRMNSYKIFTCNSFRMRSYKNRGGYPPSLSFRGAHDEKSRIFLRTVNARFLRATHVRNDPSTVLRVSEALTGGRERRSYVAPSLQGGSICS